MESIEANSHSADLIPCDIIRIHTFGRFDVVHADGSINNSGDRSKKTWSLLKYMIANKDKRVTIENIVDDLFPSEEYHDPSNTIKNLVHRLRKILQYQDGGKMQPIIFQKGGYCLNRTKCIYLDTDEFESVSDEAYVLEKVDPLRAISLFAKGQEIYKGDFLKEDSDLNWLMPARLYYRRLYLKNCLKHMSLLRHFKEYEEITRVGANAMRVEEFEEDIHAMFMEALLRLEKYHQVAKHFLYLSKLFKEVYHITPSKHITNLYYLALEAQPILDNDNDFSPGDIVLKSGGALLCDQKTFKQILKLDLNRNNRIKKDTHLIRVISHSANSEQLNANMINSKMIYIQRILADALRSGDVIARWNDNTFFILLGGADEEGTNIGYVRIKKLLYTEIVDPQIRIEIKKTLATQTGFLD